MEIDKTLFGIGVDYIEHHGTELNISIDEVFKIDSPSVFYFKMVGSDMAPMILLDDILVVDRAKSASSDSIVLFAYGGEDKFFCRYFHSIEKNREVHFFGVVTGIIRKL